MELNLGSRAVFQLQETFQFLNSPFDCDGFLPVVNISVEIARKLYDLYIESVNMQKENQDQLLAMLNRENEIYAKQLAQEGCNSEFSFQMTSDFNFKLNDEKVKLQQNDHATHQMNSRSNKVIELIIDSRTLSQLAEQFGDFEMISEGFQPVVQVSLELAEELHSAYIQSVLLQKQNKDKILTEMSKQEKREAKKLRLQEIKQSKTTTKAKTSDYKQEEHKTNNVIGTNFRQNATNSLYVQKLTAAPPAVNGTDKNLNRKSTDGGVNEARAVHTKKTAEKCRQEAQMYWEKSQEANSKAKQAHQQKNFQVAQYYRDTARTYRDQHEKGNELAVTLLMEQDEVKHSDTLDLHCFNLKEAIQSLNLYIDAKINLLKKSKRKMIKLSIITGRGKHSANNKSTLGPAIQDLLRKRGIPFSQPLNNSGMLDIKVYSNTPLFYS